MIITFRGAAREVGRSCVDIESKQGRFLFDCGIALTPDGPVYPEQLQDIGNIDAVFLSHAHLDHSGALSLEQHRGLKAPVFCTAETKEITQRLLTDSHKIDLHSHFTVTYNEDDIRKVLNRCRIVDYNLEYKYKGVSFKYFDACHIPGSASVLANIEGKNILYTGDINDTDTKLMKGNLVLPKDTDVMIIECTYGDRDHPKRNLTEQKFITEIKNTLAKKGSVLIPAFAVGRAQEILILLKDQNIKVPIYLDGMAVDITRNFIKYGSFIKNKKDLFEALSKVKTINGYKQRKEAIKKQGIFITTSGMLSGGPVMEYLKHISNNQNNSILLTGYQAESTNGRSLLEEGIVNIDGYNLRIKCNYKQFDFSAHIGLKGLQKLIKTCSPKKLILNHGDPSSIDNLKKWAEKEGFKVYAPKLLESIKI